MEETRQLIGKRPRRVGKLRPSVVLYNEDHKDAEGVGEIVRRDLVGAPKGRGRSGADLVLVVGTSLKVPGTKRIVREFSKAVRTRATGSAKATSSESSPLSSQSSSRSQPSSSKGDSREDEPPIRSIYLNLDFPVPTREWDGVFDAWVQGDAQTFARMLLEELSKEAIAKEQAAERKRRRDDAAMAQDLPPTPCSVKKKRKADVAAINADLYGRQKSPSPRTTAWNGESASSRTPQAAKRSSTKSADSEATPLILRLPPLKQAAKTPKSQRHCVPLIPPVTPLRDEKHRSQVSPI